MRLQYGWALRGNHAANFYEAATMGSIKQFLKDDQGADLIEYALLAGLVSLACVGALTAIGGDVNRIYGQIKDKLATINVPTTP
jgi:pilus assembly protein Flp/PilA